MLLAAHDLPRPTLPQPGGGARSWHRPPLRGSDPTQEAGSLCPAPSCWAGSQSSPAAGWLHGPHGSEDPVTAFPLFALLPQNAGSQLFSGLVESKNMQPKRWLQ